MNTERISHEVDDPHAWICICGNTPTSDGFYPCDETGNIIEPEAAWNRLYVCARCGRIIEDDSLDVIEPAAS